jgi:hypothetical protein
MSLYRKKPVVIQAERWISHRETPMEKVAQWRKIAIDAYKLCPHCGDFLYNHGNVETLEGYHIVCHGDWIITGIKGETYPCKPDIFDMTYECVTGGNE